jgi:glyceraldehyde 3-phosphate dehydrogenase
MRFFQFFSSRSTQNFLSKVLTFFLILTFFLPHPLLLALAPQSESVLPPAQPPIHPLENQFADAKINSAMENVKPILDMFRDVFGVTDILPLTVASSLEDQPIPSVVHQKELSILGRALNMILARHSHNESGTVIGVPIPAGSTIVHLNIPLKNKDVDTNAVITALKNNSIPVKDLEVSQDIREGAAPVVSEKTIKIVQTDQGALISLDVWVNNGGKMVSAPPIVEEPLPCVVGSLREPSKVPEQPVLSRPLRVAINGIGGRIGRLLLLQIFLFENHDQIQIVAGNDLVVKTPEDLKNFLEYDTTHGEFTGALEPGSDAQGDFLKVTFEGRIQKIYLANTKNIQELPWEKYNVDLVIDATGAFTSKEALQPHITAGAKAVILTAPSKGEKAKDTHALDTSIVLGVSDVANLPEMIDNASCTTNCYAPAQAALESNGKIKIIKGDLWTVHAVTNTQFLFDGPGSGKKKKRSALSALLESTGAAEAIKRILKHLTGKLSGGALRVPVKTGSVAIVTNVIEVSNESAMITPEYINNLFQQQSEGKLKGILAVEEGLLSAAQVVGRSESSILVKEGTQVISLGNNRYTVRTVHWYDNEWGYTTRVRDLIKVLGQQLLQKEKADPPQNNPSIPAAA